MALDEQAGPIPGARDLLEGDLARTWRLQRTLRRVLRSYGYQLIEVPVLERSALYTRKLGGRVAGSVYSLIDQDGATLSLRPEFTASAIRAFIRHRSQLVLPVRWQYCGPVFRDRAAGTGTLRQFTQLGAEIIGAPGPWADAELVAAAVTGLRAAGLERPRLVIGHAGLIPGLLASIPLSDRARMYLGRHLQLFREGERGLLELRKGLEELQALPSSPPVEASDSESESAVNLVSWLLSEGSTRPTGRRSTEQIVRRFRSKLQYPDLPEYIDRALDLASEIAAVRAAPQHALAAGRAVVERYGLRSQPLADLESVIAALAGYDLDGVPIEVDLGLTRVLGYYTGIVFELFGGEAAEGPIGGGGRYDGLVHALGGPEVPALGFAYTVERLEAALPDGAVSGEALDPGTLVVPADAASVPHAVRLADDLRAKGEVAIVEVAPRSDGERRTFCIRHGIRRAVLVREDGVEQLNLEAAPYAPAGTS